MVARSEPVRPNFHFTSPLDNRIDRTTYFERCWPNSKQIERFEFINLVSDGDRVFVTYEGRGAVGKFLFTICSTLTGRMSMNPELLKSAQIELERQVQSGFAPGVVGLIAHGDEVHVIPVGRMALSGPAMRRDTIFRIASMTKPITAAAVMMLIEDGKLRLDDPVDRLLPELANCRVLRRLDGPIDDTVPAKRSITVEDVLTFRLGWGAFLEPPGTYPIQKSIENLGIVGFGPPSSIATRRMKLTVTGTLCSTAARPKHAAGSRTNTGFPGRSCRPVRSN